MSIDSPRRTLVTGASHPLGLELVRQCLLRGDIVYAACRSPARATALTDLRAGFSGLELLELDPADAACVTDVIPVLQELTDNLDLLVVGPAEPGLRGNYESSHMSRAQGAEQLSSLSGTALMEHYRRHAVAPLLLIRTLLPWLTHSDSGRVLVISPGANSGDGDRPRAAYATMASAVALRALMVSLARDLDERNVVVCVGNADFGSSASSGSFRSRDGHGVDAELPMEEVARGLLHQAERFPRYRSGEVVDWTGMQHA